MSEREVITAELDTVTNNLCEMMLGAGVTPVVDAHARWGGTTFRSSVSISGDWSGTLELEVSSGAAALMARSLFGCNGVSDQQCLDAVREVSNILAGNIKSALPGNTSLAIPVAASDAYGRTSSSAESSIVSMCWQFQSSDELLAVNVRRSN